MNLENVATWFFESLEHKYPDEVRVRLVEGVKGPKREMVEVTDEQSIGPYFPVKVEDSSRSLEILFKSVLSYQIIDECYAAPQTQFDAETLFGPVQKCNIVDYLNYVEKDTLIASLRKGDYDTYFVWTEDQTIFVIATEEPMPSLLDALPDKTIDRTLTYVAS